MSEETKVLGSAAGFRMDKDMDAGKFRGKRRRKVSELTLNKVTSVDYKDVALLRRFVNEHGKMKPSRQTGNTAKQQRMIARAIRRARELALLEFVKIDTGNDRREFGPRRPREHREVREAPVETVAAPVEAATPEASTTE